MMTRDNEIALEARRLLRWLGDLLATIHRDGGQHTLKVGLEQSVADAHQVWAALMGKAEAAEKERDETDRENGRLGLAAAKDVLRIAALEKALRQAVILIDGSEPGRARAVLEEALRTGGGDE